MKIEPSQIILGDCLEVMEGIADGSVDAIICDLPYEVLHKNNPHAQWDRKLPMEMLWAHYERIIKDNGAIILFGQSMFTAELMMSNPKLWRYNLVWDKMRSTGFLNANRMPLRCHEDILVFYRQMPVYHPQMTVGKPNHPRGGARMGTNESMLREVQDGQGLRLRQEDTKGGTDAPQREISDQHHPYCQGTRDHRVPSHPETREPAALADTHLYQQGRCGARQHDGQRYHLRGLRHRGPSVYRH